MILATAKSAGIELGFWPRPSESRWSEETTPFHDYLNRQGAATNSATEAGAEEINSMLEHASATRSNQNVALRADGKGRRDSFGDKANKALRSIHSAAPGLIAWASTAASPTEIVASLQTTANRYWYELASRAAGKTLPPRNRSGRRQHSQSFEERASCRIARRTQQQRHQKMS